MTPQELRQWCEDNGFAPLALANALQVNRNTVYRWQSGDLEMPSHLVSRMAEVLARRDTAVPLVSYQPKRDSLDLETQQPHGSVIGLHTAFWLEKTDAERVSWIMLAENPLLALPWPHWSHGWEWYPPERITPDGPMPARIAHYIHKSSLESLRRLAPNVGGARQAIIETCRQDFPTWFKPQASILTESAFKTLMKMADENKTVEGS